MIGMALRTKQLGTHRLENRGYNNKVFNKNGVMVAEFTDTFINAINTVNELKEE